MNNAKTEFAMARCMEIIDEDEEHKLISKEIIAIEKQVSLIASSKVKDLLSELDELKERQFSNCIPKIYLTGFNDRITPF